MRALRFWGRIARQHTIPYLVTRLRLLLVAAAVLLTALPARAQDGRIVDQIAAVIGDQILLRSEVDAAVAQFMRQQEAPYTPELWNAALQQMIDEKVLQIHARRDTTIQVTDDRVEQALDGRIRQMAAQLGGQARLEEAYGQTVIEIKAEYRDDFRNQLLGDEMRRVKMQTIKVTPSEVQSWFHDIPSDSLPDLPEMVRVGHVVRYPVITDDAREEAREILVAIRDSLTAGVSSFEEMAELFSEDPGSASNGGRYEGTALGELVPEFAAVASRIAIGEISQIFETQFGLHILRVNTRRGDVVDYNHILIRFDESKADPTPAIEFLSAVRDSISEGQLTLDLAARRDSEERTSALMGGNVMDPQTGERKLIVSALGPYWQRTLAEMNVGDISEPAEVELLDGRRAWHIVRLQDRIPAHRLSIQADYALIQQYAQREKESRIMTEWLSRLREGVYVDIRTPVPTGLSGTQ